MLSGVIELKFEFLQNIQ